MLTLLWTMTGEKVGNVKERLQFHCNLIFLLEKKIYFLEVKRSLGK